MKIRNIDLGERPVVLAPMEDVTDLGFRLMCKEFGAAMVYSEFASADALVRLVTKTMQKLAISPDERPVAIQIYGKEVEPMVEAARIVVEQAHPDVLDLNFGCPVKRVAGKGAGAAERDGGRDVRPLAGAASTGGGNGGADPLAEGGGLRLLSAVQHQSALF